jgi:peptidylprolyl isomerase
MTQANSGDTVRITYTGKLTDGTVFDSSEGRDPLEFKIGENTIIPTLEASVVGMSVGDKATVDVTAENAYGPHQPDAVQTVERSMIPAEVDLTIGAQLQATAPDGQVLVLTVAEIEDTTVTLDGNHPLAGQDLSFDIELAEIVAAGA